MRKILGTLLFVLFVLPMLCGVFFLASLNTWVFNRDFYQGILDNPAVYEAILDEATLELSGTGTVLDQIPPQALGAGLREVVTPDYMRTVSQQVVDQIFAVLDGNARQITMSIDLTPLKQTLNDGDGAERFANAIVSELPDCAAGERSRSNAAEFPTCRESGTSDQTLLAQIRTALPNLVAQIPDTLSIDEPLDLEGLENIPGGFTGVGGALTYGLISFGAVVLVIWFIVGLLLGEGRRGRLIALGVMLLIPAGAVLVVGVVMGETVWADAIRSSIMEEVPSEYATALADSAVSAVSRVRSGFLIAGGIPFVMGLILLLWGGVTPRDDDFYDDDFSIGKRKNVDDGYVEIPNR